MCSSHIVFFGLFVRPEGGGPPPTPEDPFPCGEGNLGRSTLLFFVHCTSSCFTSTLPPVEEPPATSHFSSLNVLPTHRQCFLFPACKQRNHTDMQSVLLADFLEMCLTFFPDSQSSPSRSSSKSL